MYNGYGFYMDGMLLPITPSSLKITVGSTNKTVTLINEGEVNILKSPSLTEVTFDARFPSKQYPFSRETHTFDYYRDKFLDLKESKKPFQFIVLRHTPKGIPTWDTNMTVSLETFDMKESADDGDDVIVSFKLKQWKSYGSKSVKVTGNNIVKPNSTNDDRVTKDVVREDWTVKSGDTLWSISKSVYGDGSKWRQIYNANKTTIENEAKKHGKADSRDGHWIYPNTKLVIPDLDGKSTSNTTGNNTTQTSSSSSNTSDSSTPFRLFTLNLVRNGGGVKVTIKGYVDGKPKTVQVTDVGSIRFHQTYGKSITVTVPINQYVMEVGGYEGWTRHKIGDSYVYGIAKFNASESLTLNLN